MSRLQNNTSIGWVHPKFIPICPLALGNKNMTCKKKIVVFANVTIGDMYILIGILCMPKKRIYVGKHYEIVLSFDAI